MKQPAVCPNGRRMKSGDASVGSKSYAKGTKKVLGYRGSSARRAEKRRMQAANATVTGAARPLSKLDAQAKSLGVYGDAYHCMNRTERKSIVSTALTKQRQAA